MYWEFDIIKVSICTFENYDEKNEHLFFCEIFCINCIRMYIVCHQCHSHIFNNTKYIILYK